jgi:hypothetical protein
MVGSVYIFLFHRRFGWCNETERKKKIRKSYSKTIFAGILITANPETLLYYYYYYYTRIHESRSKYGSLFIQNENALTRYNIGLALIAFSFLSDDGIKR